MGYYSGVAKPAIGAGLVIIVATVSVTLAADNFSLEASTVMAEQWVPSTDALRGSIPAHVDPVLVTNSNSSWKPVSDRPVRIIYSGHLGHGWDTTP